MRRRTFLTNSVMTGALPRALLRLEVEGVSQEIELEALDVIALAGFLDDGQVKIVDSAVGEVEEMPGIVL